MMMHLLKYRVCTVEYITFLTIAASNCRDFFYLLNRCLNVYSNFVFALFLDTCTEGTSQVHKFLRILRPSNLISNLIWISFSSRWRYRPGWALASSTICLQASRFLSLSLHSFIHYVPRLVIGFRNNFFFYRMRLLASRPTPNLEDQGIPFCLGHHFRPVQQGWPYQ